MRKGWRNNSNNIFWYDGPGEQEGRAKARVVHLPDAVVGGQKNWYRADVLGVGGNWDCLGYNKHLYHAQVAAENALKDINEAAIRERNPTDIEFHPRRPLSGSAVFESDENFVNNNFKLCVALLKWIGGES